MTASNPLAMRAAQGFAAAHGTIASSGSASNNAHAGLAMLYGQVQRQAALLAYMDQYRMFAYLLVFLLPLVLLLKRPPKITGKIELEAH
jgi:DHA2 family multidrug resistance protein